MNERVSNPTSGVQSLPKSAFVFRHTSEHISQDSLTIEQLLVRMREPPSIYRIKHAIEDIGDRFSASKKRITWQFNFPESHQVHTITLEHSLLTGKKRIRVDGTLVSRDLKYSLGAWHHAFSFDEKPSIVFSLEIAQVKPAWDISSMYCLTLGTSAGVQRPWQDMPTRPLESVARNRRLSSVSAPTDPTLAARGSSSLETTINNVGPDAAHQDNPRPQDDDDQSSSLSKLSAFRRRSLSTALSGIGGLVGLKPQPHSPPRASVTKLHDDDECSIDGAGKWGFDSFARQISFEQQTLVDDTGGVSGPDERPKIVTRVMWIFTFGLDGEIQ